MADGYPAGTTNGNNIVDNSSGNSFLNGIANISNVLVGTVSGVGMAAGTFIDRLTAYKVAQAQARVQPSTQTATSANATPNTDFSQWLKYGVFAAIVVGSAFAVARLIKAK
jgi:hypothetical protein